MGAIRGEPTRSAEFQRRYLLIGAIGRNFAPHGLAADCARELQEIIQNHRRPAIRPVLRRIRAPMGFRPVDRNSAQSPLSSGEVGRLRASRAIGALRVILGKSCKISAARRPAIRLAGAPARSTEIQRAVCALSEKGRAYHLVGQRSVV